MKAQKQMQRLRRKNRIRAKIFGTASCPRLSVFRSLKAIQAQLIDDASGKTLASVTSLGNKKSSTSAAAEAAGKDLAEKAKAAKITTCIFDRNGYAYHGRVKALAEGARAAGLQF